MGIQRGKEACSVPVALASVGPHPEPASCPYRSMEPGGSGTEVPDMFASYAE